MLRTPNIRSAIDFPFLFFFSFFFPEEIQRFLLYCFHFHMHVLHDCINFYFYLGIGNDKMIIAFSRLKIY